MRGAGSLEQIEIKNVRSLKDTGAVTLSPITLLVGENSSGKSTFLRVFPLIKQSISKRTDGPLLWAGDVDDYVDFGSFGETVTNDESNEIIFRFSFSAAGRREFHFPEEFNLSKELTKSMPEKQQIHYSITIAQEEGREYVSKLSIQINKSSFDFELTPVPGEGIVCVDGIYIRTSLNREKRSRRLHYNVAPAKSDVFGFYLPLISGTLNDLLQNDIEIASEIEADDEYIFVSPYSTVIRMLRSIGQGLCADLTWDEIAAVFSSKTVGNYSKLYKQIAWQVEKLEQGKLEKIQAVFKLLYLYEYFSQIDRYINTYFRQVHYIAPLRATAERYYRLRNLAIDEVDYQGKNLAIFLRGLPTNRMRSFQRWTQKYFGFHVIVEKSPGHLSVNIALGAGGTSINMSDTGFGYSQILPIITQLWDLSTRPEQISRGENVPLVIAIEQPELHLHPALQAKLAKAFIACIQLATENGYHLQLLIETHSDTIVNYFGRAIAHKVLPNTDVSVVLFDRDPETKHTKVHSSGYDESGYLEDWPIGFFSPKEW